MGRKTERFKSLFYILIIMAFTGIMCTEAQIDAKTGAGVDVNWTDTMKTQAVLQAESIVNIIAGYNFSDDYAATTDTDVKYILTEIVASLAAIEGISYNFLGYATDEGAAIIHAEDKINVLRDAALRGLSILRQKFKIDYINSI